LIQEELFIAIYHIQSLQDTSWIYAFHINGRIFICWSRTWNACMYPVGLWK